MLSRFRLISLWVILALLIVPAVPAAAAVAELPQTAPLLPLESMSSVSGWAPAPVPLMYDPNPIPVRVEARASDPRAQAGATIVIDYIENATNSLGDSCVTFPSQAKAPFQDAANKLAALIYSPVTIRIEGCWATLPAGVLGHSSALNYIRNIPGGVANVWYPVALANAITGSDQDTDYDDISIAYAVDFTDYFYYGTDGNAGSKTDFESVVMHEIMHGLGFAGSMAVSSGLARWGFITPYCSTPTSYDTFTVDNGGTKLTNTTTYPCQSATLTSALTSGNVYFTGANAKAANGGARVPMYAPATWRQGSSYSHFAESYNGTPNALMTYSIGPGESIHDPGPIGSGVLKDVGWPQPASYSISGQVLLSGGGAAVGVTVSDGAGHTATTNSNGDYTITGLSAGAYTVTPTWSGYSFTPPSRNVTITNASQTGVNFTATLNTYSISGQILLSGGGAAVGVTVDAGGGHTTTTNSNGDYTIAGLVPGAYTVTPSLAGYTFNPANRSATITNANVYGVGFTMYNYTISGQVLLSGGGAAAGVTVSVDGTHTATSDASGNYTITALAPGAYTVTPSKAGYTFTPGNQSVTITTANQTGVNFTATLITYTISGQILLSGGGAAVGVTVKDGAGHTVVTDASGNYTFTSLVPGTYTIKPFKIGKVFTPFNKSVVITNSNMPGNNFTALPGRSYFVPVAKR